MHLKIAPFASGKKQSLFELFKIIHEEGRLCLENLKYHS
jgi:hypothetical protein